MLTGGQFVPKFDVRIVAATSEPFRCAGNHIISPHAGIDDAKDTDIALVASFVIPNKPPLKIRYDRELDWVCHQQERGSFIAAACSGSILLADAGLLDGWEATSHWAFRDIFYHHYPKVKWRIDRKLCVSGHDNQIVTSGGATSWSDLALYLINRFCGVEYARNTAKFWVIPSPEESQAPFSAMTQGVPHDDGVINDCQVWIAEHYANPNPISAMVQRSGLPSTTFSRRFQRSTGYRPMDYVHTLRVGEAKEMLETGDAIIEEIGRDVGYEDPASFRRIFKRKVGISASVYRRRFGRKRFEQLDLVQ